LLGLPTDGGNGLFEAEWFDKGHVLAPFLNAKPNEFATAIDTLAQQYQQYLNTQLTGLETHLG
jgi:hypothetical protein